MQRRQLVSTRSAWVVCGELARACEGEGPCVCSHAFSQKLEHIEHAYTRSAAHLDLVKAHVVHEHDEKVRLCACLHLRQSTQRHQDWRCHDGLMQCKQATEMQNSRTKRPVCVGLHGACPIRKIENCKVAF